MEHQSQEIQSFFETRLPHYLDLLKQMVDINSFTANAQGVNTLGALTASAFQVFGFKANHVQSSNPNYGHHLVMHRQSSSPLKVALISHLDTVFPPEDEIKNNFHWREELPEKIYGPGTVDIKGGTIVMYMVLDALSHFAPEILDQINWYLFLNASEETISEDFGFLCKDTLGENNVLGCLIFEGGKYYNSNNFDIVVARKGMAKYRVSVEGKASHAGSAHEKGANAIVQLAGLISQIASFTDYERFLTFNVGTVVGGTVTNRVPHFAEANIEMRTFDTNVFSEGVKKMLALSDDVSVFSQDGYPCNIKVDFYHETAPWPKNEGTESLFGIWEKSAASLGLTANREERGGLSDGNLLWDTYPTLDGLGPDGANAHCSERSADGSKDQEFVNPQSLIPKAILNTTAIYNLIKHGQK